jgi:hypothetical protein
VWVRSSQRASVGVREGDWSEKLRKSVWCYSTVVYCSVHMCMRACVQHGYMCGIRAVCMMMIDACMVMHVCVGVGSARLDVQVMRQGRRHMRSCAGDRAGDGHALMRLD